MSSVYQIKYLTHLNLSKNEISSLDSFNVKDTLNFLVELNVSGNKITKLEPIHAINLKRLNLNNN